MYLGAVHIVRKAFKGEAVFRLRYNLEGGSPRKRYATSVAPIFASSRHFYLQLKSQNGYLHKKICILDA